MMSGWVTESGEYVESEDDWANGLYYADGEGDGSVVTNAWVYTTVPDDTNEDETEPTYHFYFGSNGKKTVSTKKSIGGKEYFFDERGVAQYGWHKGAHTTAAVHTHTAGRHTVHSAHGAFSFQFI